MTRHVFIADRDSESEPANPEFFTHRYTFDILDNLVKQDLDATGSNPPRLITEYRYDANENQTQEIFPEGNIFASFYDERDLLFQSTRGFGSLEASIFDYNYDRNRNLVSTFDGEDNNGDGVVDETLYQFDGFDRQIVSIDPVGNQVVRNYDPNDNLVREFRFGLVGGPSPTDSSGAGNVLLSQREIKHDELNRAFQYDDLLFISDGVNTVKTPQLTEGPLTPRDGRLSMLYFYDRE